MPKVLRITVVTILLLGLLLPAALANPAQADPVFSPTGPTPATPAGAPTGAHWLWTLETADNVGDVGNYNAAIWGPTGYPWISHQDDLPNKDLLYTYKDATGWHTELADSGGATGSVGEWTSIGYEAIGWPTISYYDWTNTALKYAHKTDPTTLSGGSPTAPMWVNDTVDSAGTVGEYTSLRMDSLSRPNISYYDRTNGNLKFARKASGVWTVEVADSSANDVGQYTSLALGSGDWPRISYYDVTARALKYAYKDGVGWHTQVVDATSYAGYYTSLVLDGAGYPHIAYYIASTRDLRYAYQDALGWHLTTVDSDGDVGKYASLRLDAGGYAHISYQLDNGADADLKYAYQDARGWHVEVVDGSSTHYAGGGSLLVDADGFPAVAYMDFPGGTSTRLQYAAGCLRVDYAHPATECLNTGVTFTNYTIGQETLGYEWSFGDGVTSTLPAPTHAYTEPGVYTIALTATNACGVDTLTSTLTISGTPDASFTWGPLPACVGAPVQFTNTSVISAPASFQWNFDDGSFSVLENPSHTFALAGAFDVAVFAMNNCGIDYATNPVTVHAGPVGTFTWNPALPVVDLPVTLSAVATSTLPAAFAWDFGDGITGTGQVIPHTYSVLGVYTVTLTTTSSCGMHVRVLPVEVCGPVAGSAFDWTPLDPTRGDVVTFTGLAGGSLPISYTWAFGDGSSGAGAVVTHTYAAGGTYTATMTTVNACGQQVVEHALAVCGPVEGPSFTWLPADPVAGEAVTFSAVTSGTAPISYTWSWGDGSTGSGAVVSHTFAAGDYLVALTVTNGCGQEMVQSALHVCDPVAGAAFTWSPDAPWPGEVVTFQGSVEQGDPPITYTWAFGDGGVGAGPVVTYTYTAGGTYPVTMLATNACGQATANHVLHVCQPVTGTTFSWTPIDLVAGQVITFSAQAQGDTPITFAWAFGDGGVGNGAIVTHTFAAGGAYTVTVTASNVCGQQVVSQAVLVCGPAAIDTFSWSPAEPVAGAPITWTAVATGSAPLALDWTFGDGQSGSGAVVSSTYTVGGIFTVTLSAANACGQDELAQAVNVCGPLTTPTLTYAPARPEPGGVVTFTAAATGTAPLTYSWSFGDGDTGAGPVVTHTYATTATYSVTLVVENRCSQEQTTAAVDVSFCRPPSGLAVQYTPTEPRTGEPITFQATLSGGRPPITIAWDFDEDGVPDAYGPTATYTYRTAGTFGVATAAWNECGTADQVSTPVVVRFYAVYLPLVTRAYYAGDNFEVDDAPAQAQPLAPAVPQAHTFFRRADPHGNDVDWVWIDLAAGQPYRFWTDGLTGDPASRNDTKISLYAAGNYSAPVMENDDAGAGNCSPELQPPWPASCLVFTPSTSGRYYLKVSNYYAAEYGSDLRYNLTAVQP